MNLAPGDILIDARGKARVLAIVEAKSGPVAVMERTRSRGGRLPLPFLQQIPDMASNGWRTEVEGRD